MATANTVPPISDGKGAVTTAWTDYVDQAKILDRLTVRSGDAANDYPSTNFFGAVFARSSAEEAFKATTAEIDAVGTDSNLLLLGLKTSSESGVSLDGVLRAFAITETGLPSPINHVLSSMRDSSLNQKSPSFVIDKTKRRNAMWLRPSQIDQLETVTTLSLRLKLDGALQIARDFATELKSNLGIKLPENLLKFEASKLPTFRLTRRSRVSKLESGDFQTESAFSLTVIVPLGGFFLTFTTDTSKTLSFTIIDDASDTRSAFAKIGGLLSGAPDQTTSDPEESTNDGQFISNAKLWVISVAKNGSSFDWDIAFYATLNLLGQSITITLTYSSSDGTFTGSLLTDTILEDRLLPSFLLTYEAIEGLDLTAGLDLRRCQEFETFPDNVPSVLTQALIAYRKKQGASPASLLLSAIIRSSSSLTNSQDDVPAPFDWEKISFDFVKTGPSLKMSVATSFMLKPSKPAYKTGIMSARLDYDKSSTGTAAPNVASTASAWTLTAKAQDIQLGAIAAWFDKDLSNELASVLGAISIEDVDVKYKYTSKKASSFLLSSSVLLGSMRLRMLYQYAKSGVSVPPAQKPIKQLVVPKGQQSAWRFDAVLDPTDSEVTVGDVIDGVLNSSAEGSDDIPDFIRDIKIKNNQPNDHLVSLTVTKEPGGKDTDGKVLPDHVVFMLNVNLSNVSLSFIQISTAAEVPSPGKLSQTKRILRLSAGRIPLIENLPVVKELPQPFEELQYMWVTPSGLSKLEVAAVNNVADAQSRVMFKSTSNASNPIVLRPGHHFIVINNDEAILDHVCSPDTKRSPASAVSDGNKPQNPSLDPPNAGAGTGAAGSSNVPRSNSQQQVSPTTPSKGILNKTTKLLDIISLSLEYKDKKLWIYLDATLRLGPLEFSLIGFGVGIAINNLKFNDLSTIGKTLDSLEFQLRGMQVAFDKPPILIAGVFEMATVQTAAKLEKSYRGGICVQIPPYALVAVGEYAEVTEMIGTGADAKSKTYKSVFIYAKLDGPLIDLQFAIIKGVRLGFGYNSMIRSPGLSELYQYPLISDTSASGTGNNPMLILNNMRKGPNPWITTQDESYWFAFGFTLSSLDLISATAVAVVAFRDGGPIFSIYGNLIIENPPKTPDFLKMLYIEIQMMAELNFAEDGFKVMASLAPCSFVYCPQAKLQGGFAMYLFFGRHQYAGDWVLTIGGYHRKFVVPSHYPQDVARLGLNFSIEIVHIRALGYFAITPKAVMAGAAMHVDLQIGPVYAWLDAAFDALIQYNPLHYWVDMHVEVGVQCRIPMGAITIRISISIGAELHIEGPAFGGTAYVDFWFFSFSIPFGKSPALPPPLTLVQFYGLCLRGGPSDTGSNDRLQAKDDLNVRLKFALEDGAFSMPTEDTEKDVSGKTMAKTTPDNTGAGTKWFVKGGSFKFRVSSVFAISKAYIETPESAAAARNNKLNNLYQRDVTLMKAPNPTSNNNDIWSRPMQSRFAIQAPLYVGIDDMDNPGVTTTGWTVDYVIKPVPLALWSNASNSIDPLSADKGTVDHKLELAFKTPPPVLAKAKIPQFNATDMSKACVGLSRIPQPDPTKPEESVQSSFLPDAAPPASATGYTDMKKLWESTAASQADMAKLMLAACTSVLGWDKPSPDVLQTADLSNPDPWSLNTTLPERLVSGTGGVDKDVVDGFENYYLELPRISSH